MFGEAWIGLHTMVDEHFGITVVEFMVRSLSSFLLCNADADTSQAAGLIPLVHASAGPLLDIVVPYSLPSDESIISTSATGYHATSAQTFADHLHTIIQLSPTAATRMRELARANAVERFSTANFEKSWNVSWQLLLKK